MRLVPLQNKREIGAWAAQYVVNAIHEYQATANRPFVLGLPTGSSSLLMYQQLIRHYQQGHVSFQHVVTFNMDEYVGLPKAHPQSYHSFMYENFFNHIDIPDSQIHLLEGDAEDLEKECLQYEEMIASYGGADLFIGGLGENGHIAFNEPGSSLKSRTRKMRLTEGTRQANARFFDYDIDQVPISALTIGVATLMDAKAVLLLISGKNKSLALQQAVEGYINHMWTVTALQAHEKAILLCDPDSCGDLKVNTLRYFSETEKGVLHPQIL